MGPTDGQRRTDRQRQIETDRNGQRRIETGRRWRLIRAVATKMATNHHRLTCTAGGSLVPARAKRSALIDDLTRSHALSSVSLCLSAYMWPSVCVSFSARCSLSLSVFTYYSEDFLSLILDKEMNTLPVLLYLYLALHVCISVQGRISVEATCKARKGEQKT